MKLTSGCRSLLDFIDAADASALQQISRALLPPDIIVHASTCLEIQAMLRQLAMALVQLREVHLFGVYCAQLPEEISTAQILWCPQYDPQFLAIISESCPPALFTLSIFNFGTLKPAMEEPVRLWRSKGCQDHLRDDFLPLVHSVSVRWSKDGRHLSCVQVTSCLPFISVPISLAVRVPEMHGLCLADDVVLALHQDCSPQLV